MDPNSSQDGPSDDTCTFNEPASYTRERSPLRGAGSDVSAFPKQQPSFAHKTKSKRFNLSRGFIKFRPGSTSAEKMIIRQQQKQWELSKKKDKMPKVIPDTWLFFNEYALEKNVQLYGSQAVKLFKHLPDAYEAFLRGDPYYKVIDENKTQLLTLEIYTYNEKTNVSLKKSFKPEDKADDPDQDWLPTGHHVTFTPHEDDPDEMLDFVLMCVEK
jgi:hypothetical protein